MASTLGMLQKERPGIAIAVKTRHASRSILNQMGSALNDLKADGEFSASPNYHMRHFNDRIIFAF